MFSLTPFRFTPFRLTPCCLLLSLVTLAGGCNGSSAPPAPPGTAGTVKEEVKPAVESLAPPGTKEEDYYPLRLADFEVFSEKETDQPTWREDGDEIVCSGDPRGYIYSTEEHRNFLLKFEFQFNAVSSDEEIEKLNTGLLVYIQGEHKRWPVSLEVQGKFVEMCSIKPNGGAADVEITEDSAARESARKAPGEWNAVVVKSVAGKLTAFLNGTLICENKPGELKQGAIGFQSEGVEVRFRNLKVLDFE